MKEILLGKSLEELKQLAKHYHLPSYTARQIAEWLYDKNIQHIDEMTNLSKKVREVLAENFEMGAVQFTERQKSADGTTKYLFPTNTSNFIEAVYIPEKERNTLCISSQVGCKMGCLFCMTARQGFQKHLSAGEIVNQVRSLPERDQLTNIVYMGMGEPFDNTIEVLKSIELFTGDYAFGYSPKRITVSTIGIIPGMQEFLKHSQAHLAVSLHTPFDEERNQLMPVQTVYPIKEVIETLKKADLNRQRRISFEYIMFKGLNDTPKHVKELTKLLNKVRCRINLIRFHPIPNTPLEGSDEKTIHQFREQLVNKGIRTTVRASRGEDIFAACGMLSTKKWQQQHEVDY
jgi:23S rRNA (adenine2503-C2)-methyltransferase